MLKNILKNIKPTSEKELIDVLLKDENILIEHIVSYGFPSPEGIWYNQEKKEWVVLLTGKAEIEFKDGTVIKFKAGDYIFIPAHQEHRVIYTSKEPNCIWLAFHF